MACAGEYEKPVNEMATIVGSGRERERRRKHEEEAVLRGKRENYVARMNKSETHSTFKRVYCGKIQNEARQKTERERKKKTHTQSSNYNIPICLHWKKFSIKWSYDLQSRTSVRWAQMKNWIWDEGGELFVVSPVYCCVLGSNDEMHVKWRMFFKSSCAYNVLVLPLFTIIITTNII